MGNIKIDITFAQFLETFSYLPYKGLLIALVVGLIFVSIFCHQRTNRAWAQLKSSLGLSEGDKNEIIGTYEDIRYRVWWSHIHRIIPSHTYIFISQKIIVAEIASPVSHNAI